MRLARILGAIGRGLISAGVIVLLFVAYQLWGTGLQHSAAQGNLEDDFIELLEEAEVAADPAESEAVADVELVETKVETEDSGPVEVNVGQVDYTDEELNRIYPDEGDSLARIVIEDINVDQIVVAGTTVEALRKGPGHYLNTPNPGQAGNAAIAGHRTTYGAPFHRIDELEPGAKIVVQTVQGTFEYRVTSNEAPDGTEKGHFIVFPSDTWVLGQDFGNMLTLTACHPKFSARQRIIVQAELVGEPVDTIPRSEADDFVANELIGEEQQVISDEVAADDDPTVDAAGNPIDDETAAATAGAGAGATAGASGRTISLEQSDAGLSDEIELTSEQSPFSDDDGFGEGLNGDPTKIRPAFMWGLSGLFIWMTASFIGKRLSRRWMMYTVGIVPFGLVLWSCFVNVDQALPSF